MNASLSTIADAVVMLTWSDWFTELRSNRYHYASRFSKDLPVIFVQPDLPTDSYLFEKTEFPNLVVLHLSAKYDDRQVQRFNEALLEYGIIRPILWTYNSNFQNILKVKQSVLNVYHATEDYLLPGANVGSIDSEILQNLHTTLRHCDLVISVSEGVSNSLKSYSRFRGACTTVTNGCDYKFYAPLENSKIPKDKIVFYQGNIFDKLDYELLKQLAIKMPDWHFNFCGRVLFNEKGWRNLCVLKNVTYLGLLKPEQLKEKSYKAMVGILPFTQSECLLKSSFPLKTFEYLATGLPVVSIPIHSLLPFSDVLMFASTVDEFEAAIRKSEVLRSDPAHLALRLQVAAAQDYDIKFEEIKRAIDQAIAFKKPEKYALNVAVLYEPESVRVNTIKEYLESFQMFSRHRIHYIPATQDLPCFGDLDLYDAVVFHYSIRVSIDTGKATFSSHYVDAIKKYSGYKILFIQDEYEGTEIARRWIKQLGIHCVYTCVPPVFLDAVYPKKRFPHVEFVHVLTGYTPIRPLPLSSYVKTTERKILIGYRGRKLPYWYGSLGQEKLNIGLRMKEYCLENQLDSVDIECDDSKRIYGEGWYNFLASCRATLGTESGANLFDSDGSIRKAIEDKLKENPNISYAEVYDEMVSLHETVQMNQISPKVFEAISLKTALILFEGNYSYILRPGVHYISLKKDFSNISEVMEKLQDDEYIEQLTERAYQDIIEAGKSSYHQFIGEFDQHLLSKIKKNEYSKDVLISYVGRLKGDKAFLSNIQQESLPLNKVLNLKQINFINEVRFQSEPMSNIWNSYEEWVQGTSGTFSKKERKFLRVLRFSQKNCPAFIKHMIWKCMPGSIEKKMKSLVNDMDEPCVG